MATEQSAPKTPRAQKILVINKGGYTLKLRGRWQDDKGAQHETDWTSEVPVGHDVMVDMSGQTGITTGRKMWPFVFVRWGNDMTGEAVEYAPNGQMITYEATGTTLHNSLNRKS